jgi:2-amino-4-hydroxy-6-hydroxymethyldihydropteridine diphosphokinase
LASENKVYIGIGSNLGAKEENCRQAIAALAANTGCSLVGHSPFYETEPFGFEDQDWFINGVVQIRTAMSPNVLHEQLQAIESAVGRRHGGKKYGPRVLDLDILLFDDVVLHNDQLEIPHPRLHERRFVLQPLCDLAPELVHPVLGQTIQYLLTQLEDSKKVVPLPL